MLLLIYKLDSDTNASPVCVLKEGEHVIGRGEILKCNDHRASRTHAIIKIKDKNATITSTHQNPCFFQSANSTTVVILTKDVPTNLYDGDKFGIFPDQFWFKIKFEINSIDVDAKVTAASSPKRFATEDLNETPCKVTKLENGHLSTTNNLSNGDAVVDIVKSTTPEEKENSGTCNKRNSRKATGKPTYTTNSSEEDDYDYSDPFLNDDSEDDYLFSCSECDSDDDDWTPSNNPGEESEEDTKTLMKEAKKFTKDDD